jgi:hypothetical protein
MAVYTPYLHLRGLIDATQQYGTKKFLFTHLQLSKRKSGITFKIYRLYKHFLYKTI